MESRMAGVWWGCMCEMGLIPKPQNRNLRNYVSIY